MNSTDHHSNRSGPQERKSRMSAEPSTWYEIEWGTIQPLTVVRETEKCVFFLSPYYSRPTRKDKHISLFRTMEAAQAELHARLRKAVVDATERLRKAESELRVFEEGKAEP